MWLKQHKQGHILVCSRKVKEHSVFGEMNLKMLVWLAQEVLGYPVRVPSIYAQDGGKLL